MRIKDPVCALPHPGAKDIDNLFKAVADCLIGICYQDDKQVALLNASKWYHEKDRGPRAEITIDELT
jgi:Holliday junction resolvase RusA-like endonuclease